MANTYKENKEYFLEINQIKNSKIKALNFDFEFKHFIVFGGKGLNQDTVDTINKLAKLTRNKELHIGITDRGDLYSLQIDTSIYKIPLMQDEKFIPEGQTTENFLVCEFNSISNFIKKNNFDKILFFSRFRKDIFINLDSLINYLICVPTLKKKYRYICSEQSTNLLRRYCISDIFFTMDTDVFLQVKLPYRYKIKNNLLNWFWYRQPYEIFKNDHQLEQWLWKNIINSQKKELSPNCNFNDYLNYLKNNFLIISSRSIGFIWTRGGKYNLFNNSRFVPFGKNLFINTNPPSHFLSFNTFLCKVIRSENSILLIKIYRIFFFIKQSIVFVLKLPFYLYRKFIKK